MGRSAIFVAIVWGVAGSYIAIQIALEQGLDFVLVHPSWFGGFGLDSATRDSRTCTPDDRGGEGGGASITPDVRLTAWLLGMKVGRDAIARQYASVDPGTLAAGQKDIQMLAGMASVPAPLTFVPEHAVNANTSFIDYVENEANATARALATHHTAEACHLFKLGALWGYADMVRPALPGERSLFAAEIRHHADGVVPADLVAPMVATTAPDAKPEAIFRADAATTQRIAAYLSAPR